MFSCDKHGPEYFVKQKFLEYKSQCSYTGYSDTTAQSAFS